LGSTPILASELALAKPSVVGTGAEVTVFVRSAVPWEGPLRKRPSQERTWSKRLGAWTVVAREEWCDPGAAVAGSAKPRVARSTRTAVRRRMTGVRDIEHPS
jgi:hypothetical protein